MTSQHASGGTVPRSVDALEGRRVVFLNWRDSEHPQAGGAELFCHSVAERFAAAGADAVLLTARPSGQPAAVRSGGVDVRRAGGTFGVYPATLARLARLARSPGGVHAVIDCQNGIPFFSPVVVPRSTPVVQVVHHVHQKQFPLYFPGPAAKVGQLLETPGSRWVYGVRPNAVVSPSTRDEVRDVLGLRGPRFLVPNGVDLPAGPPAVPTPNPTIVCVGRLVPHKRLHLLVDALPGLLTRHPKLTVHMVGDGPDAARLRELAADTGIDQSDGSGEGALRWHGYTTAAVRDELLSTAWLTVNPSHGEGWGLSVLEAAGFGVPAVAFRVPGLRDAVRDGQTGWLVDAPADLGPTVGRALDLLADPAAADQWRRRAQVWAQGFGWDTTAELLARVVTAEVELRRGRNSAAVAAVGRRLDTQRLDTRRLDRRRLDTEVTHVEFDASLDAQLAGLRRTDLVHRSSPTRMTAVLYGAGPAGARAAMTRIGVTRGAEYRPATSEDLLLAVGPATRAQQETALTARY